jgi:hypothetical protein
MLPGEAGSGELPAHLSPMLGRAINPDTVHTSREAAKMILLDNR